MPIASHSSPQQRRFTLQETEAKIPPPVPGQQLLRKGRIQNKEKFLIQVEVPPSFTLEKIKNFWEFISKNLYISVPGLLLAIVVVWTIYKRITEAEQAGAAICFRWTALRIHKDDYKFLFIGQFLQNGSFWHKDKKKSSKIDAKLSDTWESLSFLPSVKCSPEQG